MEGYPVEWGATPEASPDQALIPQYSRREIRPSGTGRALRANRG